MTKKEHGLFGGLIAEALNVPSEQVDEALDKMRENLLNGWHPASELPPLNETLNSVPLVVICEHHGRQTLPKYACIVEGVWTEPNVKWWCYPPKD